LLPLEAMRGVAAIIVTLYHFSEAFVHQAFPLLLGTPGFVLINGDAAVVFFFALSGYVNGRSVLRDSGSE
jgi:peptidoglycan/LPS O-acetylase OafA/YrhL